ncbi:MAG: hypothetical protein GY801_37375, partial [bacterium]|nr:hypothetical protein [bacterium]
WSVHDRLGNGIYITQERWEHIIDAANHPEVEAYEEYLKRTLRTGRRTQDPLNPRKYRYVTFVDDLPAPVNTLWRLSCLRLKWMSPVTLPRTIMSQPPFLNISDQNGAVYE